MLDDFRLYFFNDDFWVSLDITINASKDPELKGGIREIVPRYRLGVYRRWVGILSEQGWSTADAEEIVRMSAALTTGLGIRTLFDRSEEHTSELQSLMRISYAVFCLKKKKHKKYTTTNHTIPTYIRKTNN